MFWGRSLGTAMAAYAATKTRPDRLILESGFPGDGTQVPPGPDLNAVYPFASSISRRSRERAFPESVRS